MKAQLRDKAVSRMLRLAAKKEVRSGEASKLRDGFVGTVLAMQPAERGALEHSFEVVRVYWHEASRQPNADYRFVIQSLLAVGLPESASAVFEVCIDAIAAMPFEALIDSMPSASCIDIWLKRSEAPVQSLFRCVTAEPERYYDTAWYDWFLRKAPLKALSPIAGLALEGKRRPAYLPDAPKLLALVLERDRKLALSDALLKAAVQDVARMKLLVLASSCSSNAGEAYARAVGLTLARKNTECYAAVVAGALEELVRGSDKAAANFAAQFAAHVATTWRLAMGIQQAPKGIVENELLRLSAEILLMGLGDDRREFWLATTPKTVADRLLIRKGAMSPQGAMEIALALRAAQSNRNAFDALWSASFNLGIREIGKPDLVEPFDPILHEDIRGGLLRGDNARMVRCGWRLGDNILLREQVEPA